MTLCVFLISVIGGWHAEQQLWLWNVGSDVSLGATRYLLSKLHKCLGT